MLGVLVNVFSAAPNGSTPGAGVSSDLSSAIGDTISALGSASLRAMPDTGGSVSMAAGPSSAFSTSPTASFCGVAVAMTAARMSPSNTSGGNASTASASIGIGKPLSPCIVNASAAGKGTASPVLPPPAASFSAGLLSSAAGAGSSVDAVMSQWSVSPYPTNDLASTNATGTNTSEPSSAIAGLASRVTSISLQSSTGDEVKVSGLKVPIYITLPLADPSLVNASATTANNSIGKSVVASQPTPLSFNITCPTQQQMLTRWIRVNSTIPALSLSNRKFMNLSVTGISTEWVTAEVFSVEQEPPAPTFSRLLRGSAVSDAIEDATQVTVASVNAGTSWLL